LIGAHHTTRDFSSGRVQLSLKPLERDLLAAPEDVCTMHHFVL
jgi:hypothetical protein